MGNQKQTISMSREAVEKLKELCTSGIADDGYYLRGVNLCDTIVSLVDAITDRTDNEVKSLSTIDYKAVTEKAHQIITIAEIVREMFQHRNFTTLKDFIYHMNN